MELDCCTKMELRTLGGGTIEPPDADRARGPAVILRRTAGTVPVWEVAKQYGAEVAALCAANALEGDEVEAGTLLLIPV